MHKEKILVMHFDINTSEQRIFNKQYPDCNKLEGRGDIILVYSDEFQGDIYETANALQSMTDFLKYITCLNPVQFYNSRIMVGHSKNPSKAKQPNWSGREGNRIYIPWKNRYFKKDELLDSCTHELVHPFFRVSPLHHSNERWGEGFCDFLRGPVKNLVGLDGKIWWKEKIKQAQSNKQDRGGNVAGQLVLRAQKEQKNFHDIDHFIEWFIINQEAIKIYVRFLFDRFSDCPMSEEFCATEWIKKGLGTV